MENTMLEMNGCNQIVLQLYSNRRRRMKFNLNDFLELDTTALPAVNGGSGGGTKQKTSALRSV